MKQISNDSISTIQRSSVHVSRSNNAHTLHLFLIKEPEGQFKIQCLRSSARILVQGVADSLFNGISYSSFSKAFSLFEETKTLFELDGYDCDYEKLADTFPNPLSDNAPQRPTFELINSRQAHGASESKVLVQQLWGGLRGYIYIVPGETPHFYVPLGKSIYVLKVSKPILQFVRKLIKKAGVTYGLLEAWLHHDVATITDAAYETFTQDCMAMPFHERLSVLLASAGGEFKGSPLSSRIAVPQQPCETHYMGLGAAIDAAPILYEKEAHEVFWAANSKGVMRDVSKAIEVTPVSVDKEVLKVICRSSLRELELTNPGIGKAFLGKLLVVGVKKNSWVPAAFAG